MKRYTIGVDFGQASDYTAIAVLEESATRRYDLRHLERYRHRPYPEIIDRIGTIVGKLPGTPAIAADATGVGRPVIDMLRDARFAANVYPVTITAGDTVVRQGLERRVPKRDLCSTVAVLLQTDRLRIAPALEHARTLYQELLNFRVKISLEGHDTYAAWREADHDDLVLAVACAAWLNEHGHDAWIQIVNEWRDEQDRKKAVANELLHRR